MLGWQWLGRLWQCRSLSGRCESLPCHCHFAAFRHLPSNLITHLALSPSCQKPDIIYVFALCKLLGLSQKRGTTMKKQLSHHIKLEGVQSKFKLKTKRQLANDFNMIGASWNMHGDNMNTEIAWKQQTPILPSPTFELCARKVKKYGKLVSPGRNLFCLLWPRTTWDLFYAGVQTTRICENEAINCKTGIHQFISQYTSCCSSDSESTHNANGPRLSVRNICCDAEVRLIKRIVEPMNGVDSVSVNPFSKICAVEAGTSIGSCKQLFFFRRLYLPLTSFDIFGQHRHLLERQGASKQASKQASK